MRRTVNLHTSLLCPVLLVLVACGDDADGAGSGTETEGATSSTGLENSATGSGSVSGQTNSATSGDDASSGEQTEGSSGGPPPDVAADVYYTVQNQALTVSADAGLIANDAAGTALFDADPASAFGGTVSVESDGSFEYTPADGSWGPDSFEYRAAGPDGQMAAATVTVFVEPRRIPLADVLQGEGGFVIQGGESNEQLGLAVSAAGDVNGDGLADLLVGDSEFSPNTFADGRAYVVFGKEDTQTVNVDSLGDAGFELVNAHVVVDAIPDVLRAGVSLSTAGDFNGDGLADVIVGGDGSLAHGPISWIVFGKQDTDTVTLRSLGGAGIEIRGGSFCSGSYVEGIGDFDGDGFDDVVLGAPCADPGVVDVVFGSADPQNLDLDADAGRSVRVRSTVGSVGSGVSPAGDFNADGLADFLTITRDVGAYFSTATVVFGAAGRTDIDLDALGDRAVLIGAPPGHGSLRAPLGHAGDFDGDGSSDVLVSVADQNFAYVLRGGETVGERSIEEIGPDALVLDGLDGSAMGRRAVDVNGDGLSDALVGDRFAGDAGAVWVVFGGPRGATREDIEMGSGGIFIEGAAPDDDAGHSLDGAGDVNGDGVDDLIIGAPGADFLSASKRAFVVFGVPTPP